jgi:DNA-binding transcriptional ArsR family regulator
MARPAVSEDVFRAIADPVRRRILVRLVDGEQPASELAAEFDVTFSAVSQHLKLLRDSRLVSERRDGRQRIYRLEPKPLEEVSDWIGHFEQFWAERLGALGTYLKKKKKKREKK